ncbi:MAG: hypothetical protein M3Z32_06465 [Acidobacteriota bacterium]|nr:hypothetical protein [Acidobacteriota bacterium]
MTDTQLYLAISLPILFNAAKIGILVASVNGLNNGLNAGMSAIEARMLNLENTFTTRFDLLMGRLIELEKGDSQTLKGVDRDPQALRSSESRRNRIRDRASIRDSIEHGSD